MATKYSKLKSASLSAASRTKGIGKVGGTEGSRRKHKSEDTTSRYSIGYRRLNRRTIRKTFSVVQYKYLPTTGIELPYDWEWNEDDHPAPQVPPTTPRPEDFGFQFRFQRLPNIPQDLSTLEIPLVRKIGIKRCIEELGLYFDCKEFKYNYLQFWFLDTLTDCIWRAQDRFEFSPDQQKIILSWVLFSIDIIGDVNYSYTKREFFDIFKEAIIAAAEVLEEGGNEILQPLKLIKIRTGYDSEVGEEGGTTYESSAKSCAIVSTSTEVSPCSEESKSRDVVDYDSIYEIQLGRDKLQVVLDHEVCQCSNYDESLSGHIKEEADDNENSEIEWMGYEEEDIFEQCLNDSDWDYRDFYKPSSRTPSRFLLSSSEEITEVTETLQKENNLSLADLGSLSKLTFLRLPTATSRSVIKAAEKLNNYIIFRKISVASIPDTIEPAESETIIKMYPDTPEDLSNIVKEDTNNDTQEQQIEKIMKGLQKLKLIEQRMRNLSDSNVGLSDWQITSLNSQEKDKESLSKEEACIPDDLLKDNIEAPENLEELNNNELINFAMLWTIIDFIYDYFSDSFQFSLIEAALTVSPNVFTQVINKTYKIPKKISEDLTSKVPDIKEKHKKFTRKLELKKSVTVAKKSKEIEAKKPKGGDKKEDKAKEKEAKKNAPKRDSKEAKQIKEELLLQQKLEHEEALRLKSEKEKAFMYPLTEAVNDRFFSRKFPNWSKFESVASKDRMPDKKKK